MYGYTFANYRDHLGIGNIRYEKLMPDHARTLEKAENQGWPIEKLAKKLRCSDEDAAEAVLSARS